MELSELGILLKNSWSNETCSPEYQELWNEKKPALGQSPVTALAVNDFLGGEIFACNSLKGLHFYNVIDGKIIDCVHKQIPGESVLYPTGMVFDRDALLKIGNNEERYLILLDNMKQEVLSLDEEINKVLERK